MRDEIRAITGRAAPQSNKYLEQAWRSAQAEQRARTAPPRGAAAPPQRATGNIECSTFEALCAILVLPSGPLALLFDAAVINAVMRPHTWDGGDIGLMIYSAIATVNTLCFMICGVVVARVLIREW